MKTVLIREAKTEYAMVIPAASAPVEETVAEELQNYLKKRWGQNFRFAKKRHLPERLFISAIHATQRKQCIWTGPLSSEKTKICNINRR